MRSVFVASIIFLVIFSGTVNGKWFPTYGHNLAVGCHHFRGKIICEDGSPILPAATVGLWEEDDYLDKDDFITDAKVDLNGTFSFRACIDDSYALVELIVAQPYLEFANACPGVDWSYTYQALDPLHLFNTYKIAKEGRRAHIIARSEQ